MCNGLFSKTFLSPLTLFMLAMLSSTSVSLLNLPNHPSVPTCAWNWLRKGRSWKSGSLIWRSAALMTECREACCWHSSSPSQSSTGPWAITGRSSSNTNTTKLLLHAHDTEATLGLGNMNKVKYHDFDWLTRYRYFGDIVGITIGTKRFLNDKLLLALRTSSFSPSCEITDKILSYSEGWNSTSLTLSNTPSRCAWKK